MTTPGPYQQPQYPAQHPGQPQGQYPAQHPGQPQGQYPGQPQGQYPAQYPSPPGNPGPGPGGPGYGGPGPGGGGEAAIAITTKYMWLAFMLALIKPKIFLNGHQVGGVWGRNVFPVPAGHHQLHIHVPYFLPPKIGPADLTLPLSPGQTVELEYAAPVFAFSSGALGPPPQQHQGMGIMIGLVVAPLVLALVCCCIFLIIPGATA